jgi:GntR family transcriptional regulator
MQLDHSASTPLYQQVAAEIRRAIAEGEAKPGERMPLAKDLGAVLGVNRNTVLRALAELRDEGLLEFRRGRSITVAGSPQKGELLAKVQELVKLSRRNGYRTEELIAMIESVP